MSEKPMIDPHGDADDVISDVPELSVEEVEKRIGARDEPRRRRAATTTPARIRTAPSNRRAILWRDSATILVFVIVALLAARFLLGNGDSGIATASPTPPPTGVAVTQPPLDTGFQFTPVPTVGDVVDPSSRLNRSPTPIPVITLGPPTPKPSETLKPGQTPKPTPQQTPTPPKASFTWSCVSGSPLVVNFNGSASTAGSAGGPLVYTWNFDDSSPNGGGATIDHPYSAPGPWSAFLKVTDASGLSDITTTQSVTACP